MLDQFNNSSVHSMQRARGEIGLRLGLKSGTTRLERLRQSGSAKAFLPKVHSSIPEVVCVNTAGGLTSDDRFCLSFEAAEGARYTATTQTAERAYRANGPPAQIDVSLILQDGAALAWLPQETILFEGARLRRSITADLAPTARLLVLESLVFGREAMGEDLSDLVFHDRWRLSRAGRLVYGDDLRVEGPVREILDASAGFAGMRAAASLVYLAPQAEDFAPRRKRQLNDPSVRLAVSGWDGVLSMRCLAPSARLLRAALVDLLTCFEDHPLPRVWQS